MLEDSLIIDNASVYLKIHPEVINGIKDGYLSNLIKLPKNVFIISEHINTFDLIEKWKKFLLLVQH